MEIQECMRVKELNIELMEHLSFTARWILRYCEGNDICPPDIDKLMELIAKSRQTIQKMDVPYSPTDTQHQRSDQQRKETPDKDNNTIIVIVFSWVHVYIISQDWFE